MRLEESSQMKERGSLQEELSELWSKFQIYKKDNPRKISFFLDKICETLEQDDGMIDAFEVDRALEMLMALDFGISLAEDRGRLFAIKDSPWGFEIKETDDPELLEAGFKLGVVKREDEESFRLWVSKELLFSGKPRVDGALGRLPAVSEYLTNNEFVVRVAGGVEEYAHTRYGLYKKEEVVAGSKTFQEFLDEMIAGIDDPWFRDVLYHSSDIEFRGLIWKGWFLRKFLPSYESINGLRIEDAGTIRSILRNG